MNKRKLGKVMFLTPFILLSTSILFRILYNNQDFFTSYLGNSVIPILEIISTLGYYIAYLFLFTYSFLLAIGGFLIFKYRDKDKPVFSIKKIFSNIEKWFKKHNTFFSKKVSWKNVVLGTLVVLVVVITFLLLRERRTNKRIEYWSQWEADNIQEQTIEQFKIDLIRNIPENYEILNVDNIPLFYQDADCDFIYDIYPKAYTEIEKKYLDYASVYFFKDINDVLLRGQIGEVSYDQTLKKWVFIDQNEKEELDVKEYEDYNISFVNLGGSHVIRDNYIVSSESTDDVVVLTIPTWSRIRCDFLKEDVERKECEDFLSSVGVNIDTDDSVPEEVYEEYYDDLLKILENN